MFGSLRSAIAVVRPVIPDGHEVSQIAVMEDGASIPAPIMAIRKVGVPSICFKQVRSRAWLLHTDGVFPTLGRRFYMCLKGRIAYSYGARRITSGWGYVASAVHD